MSYKIGKENLQMTTCIMAIAGSKPVNYSNGNTRNMLYSLE